MSTLVRRVKWAGPCASVDDEERNGIDLLHREIVHEQDWHGVEIVFAERARPHREIRHEGLPRCVDAGAVQWEQLRACCRGSIDRAELLNSSPQNLSLSGSSAKAVMASSRNESGKSAQHLPDKPD